MEAEGGVGGRGSEEAPPWAVRVRRSDGTIAGSGVLVAPEWVLTHAGAVVEGEYVTAEFAAPRVTSRRAVAEHVCAAGAGGVALLRLHRPGPAGAASAPHRLSVPRRRVRIYGFPAADGAGRWLAAETGAVAVGADGRVRLAPAERLDAGFGGAGAVDAVTGQIVGVVLPGDAGADRAGPCLSPAETVAGHLPRAADWTRGWPAVDERLRVGGPAPGGHVADGDDPGGPEPAAYEPQFAVRLAQWFVGDPRGERHPDHHADRAGRGARTPAGPPAAPHHRVRTARRPGDGRQVKISRVRAEDLLRAATLRRALLLADRERSGPAGASAPGPVKGAWANGSPAAQVASPVATPVTAPAPARGPATEPATAPSFLDLALDATGRGTRWVAERVADRLGVLPEGLEEFGGTGYDATVERILAAPATLTLVVVGVDEAADPDTLLGLLDRLRVHGVRMLLVFRHDGACIARAQSQLVIEPAQERQARLVEALTEITGTLADALHERMAVVRADCDRALDALVRAYAVRAAMAGALGVATGRGEHPDLGRFERVAARAERHLREAVERLDPLIERRAELIGRLDSYQVLHQQAVDSEDLAAEDRYGAARDLLHARPCDLVAAEAAVREYTDFIDRLGGHHPPPDDAPPTDTRPTDDGPPPNDDAPTDRPPTDGPDQEGGEPRP
ncbi:serine protease [Actinacidiphila sp. bgisy145]|uniref:serine protease n=1 Tax=Actinacidiphila sp. bgisy145 TaxID=3413792 RepID=UPI003EB87CE9